MEGGYCRSTFENGAYDMGSRDHEHRDHRVLDDLVRRLSAVIEHEQAYHEEREVYAYKPGSAAGSVGIFENGVTGMLRERRTGRLTIENRFEDSPKEMPLSHIHI